MDGAPIYRRETLPLARPQVGVEELQNLEKVLVSGTLTRGSFTSAFEEGIARHIDSPHTIATSSCTAGLHLALLSLGLPAQSEVLVPDFTFPATANAVIQAGARPVFVDIDLETFNLDPKDLERKISPTTKAILPVHLFGLAANMEAILRIAEQAGIEVIEDAACALGSRIGNRYCGTFSKMGVFSFHPRKILTTGEGGMISTADPEHAKKLRLFRNQGRAEGTGWKVFRQPGLNFWMSELQAAVGVAQCARLDLLLNQRQRLAQLYQERLAHVQGITLPKVPHGYFHSFQSYVLLLDPSFCRETVLHRLKEFQIEATIGTYALHLQPSFRNYLSGGDTFPRSKAAFESTVAIPFFTGLTAGEVDYVGTCLEKTLKDTTSLKRKCFQ